MVTPLALTLSSDPPPAADGTIARDANLLLLVDDYPDPDSAVFGPLQLRSGRGTFDVDLHVDLIGRAIVIHPRSLLQASTRYELAVQGGVRALDGRVVGGHGVVLAFTSGDALGGPTPPAFAGFAEVRPLLAGCAPSCHAPVDAQGLAQPPARGLDLTGDLGDPALGLIQVPSVGLAGTPRQLERVAPGDSARSDLLRKLLGGDAHLASQDAPYPELAVDGRRMPIEDAPGKPTPPPFTDAQLRLIQSWIDGGAPLR